MHVPTPTLPIGLRLLRNYSGRHLPQDVLAGLLVAALAVPQALGYAVVAGVPVQVGLYTLPPALLAYALFGSSRLLFVGPVSTVSVLSGSIVGALSDGDRALAITLTATLALTAGAVLVAVGLLRLGWVAQFLSEPIVTGFVAGLVVLIVIGEIPALAGVSAPSGGIFQRIDETVRNLGDFHGVTLAVGASALGVLFVGSRLLPRAPWSLIVLAGGIAVSTTGDLASRGVRVVGEVPTGLPLPSMPVVDVQPPPAPTTRPLPTPAAAPVRGGRCADSSATATSASPANVQAVTVKRIAAPRPPASVRGGAKHGIVQRRDAIPWIASRRPTA